MDAGRLALQERADLGYFLSGLSPEQWDGRSPCGRYRVRDVVDDLLVHDPRGVRALLGHLLSDRSYGGRGRGVRHPRPGPDNAVSLLLTVERRALRSPARLVARVALAESLIHHQIIRRWLEAPRRVPADRLVPVLDHTLALPLPRGFRRVHGLRLVATDVDWSAGRGPLVIGPGEALLMAFCGCREAAEELSGDGRKIVDERLPS